MSPHGSISVDDGGDEEKPGGRAWRAGNRIRSCQSFLDFISSPDAVHVDGVRGEFDSRQIEFLEVSEVLKHSVEVRVHSVEFGFGQVKSGQICDVAQLVPRNRHGRSLAQGPSTAIILARMPGNPKRPRFTVLSYLVAVLAIAAVGLRLASNRLPENKPNRMSEEYGAYARAAGRSLIDWYPFSAEPFARAKERGRLILLEVGSQLSRESRIYTDRYFKDSEVIRLLKNHFVCIRVDAEEMPWVADLLNLNEPLMPLAGDCLVAVLDSEGRIVSESPFRILRSRRDPIGLYDWLTRLTRAWVTDKREILRATEASQRAREAAASAFGPGQGVTASDVSQLCAALAGATDMTAGGLRGAVSPVAAPILSLLGAERSNPSRGARIAWLLRLRESPCYEQVDGGFFYNAAAQSWRDPRYGIRTGTTALLAAEYAEAGRELGSGLFTFTARQTMNMLIERLIDPSSQMFFAGLATDMDAFEKSEYYDWKEDELPESARNTFVVYTRETGVGPLGLRNERDFELGASESRAQRIRSAIPALADVRQSRPEPEVVANLFAEANGKAVSGIVRGAQALDDQETLGFALRVFERARRAFVQPLGDVLFAPAGKGRTTGYAGAYAWMARAAIDCYGATGDVEYLSTAQKIVNRQNELFWHERGGYTSVLSSECSFAGFYAPVRPYIDTPDESLNSVSVRNLIDLAQITGDASYWDRAYTVLTVFGRPALTKGEFGSGIARCILLAERPALLCTSNVVEEVRRRLPGARVLLAPPGRVSRSGIYLLTGAAADGPVSIEDAAARIGLSLRPDGL